MKSSLTFQLSLYLGSYVIALFAILEVTIMIYKFVGTPEDSGTEIDYRLTLV